MASSSSIPHFCSDYRFSSDEFSDITSVMARENYGGTVLPTSTNPGGAMLCRNHITGNHVMFDSNCGLDVLLADSDSPSPVPTSSFSDGVGVSDTSRAAATLVDYKFGYGGIARTQNHGGGYNAPYICEYGDDCCDFIPNFKPLSDFPVTGENWGIQCNGMAGIDQNNMKVGRYTAEERKDKITRYLKKRNQRNFNKTIKYACRKTLADRRVRVHGRFARNNKELCEEENEVKKNNLELHQEKEAYCSDDMQIKNEDEEWLQEAMESLIPYITG